MPLSKKSSLSFGEELSHTSSQKHRKIAKLPIKVLDAPALQDDFYLNLIDWSEQNLLAVGLSSSVYLWSAVTSKVSKLCDLGINDSVTAVSWTLRGPMLGIGTNSGEVSHHARSLQQNWRYCVEFQHIQFRFQRQNHFAQGS
jgi:cell division cycle 20-like protein 1 (cofactor of APC complex)